VHKIDVSIQTQQISITKALEIAEQRIIEDYRIEVQEAEDEASRSRTWVVRR
jgi:hypothetical protein